MIKISMRQTVSRLALMLALTATGISLPAAAATTDAPPPARAQATTPGEMPPPAPGMGPHFGGAGPRGPMGPAGHGGPGFAAARTIEEIAHLYRIGGHPENVLPFYRETLTQTRDPMLRHHLREAIAREELKPSDTTAAIATLRAQLSEDLAALPSPDAKRR
ncbi:hypothetical protein PAQ31011_04961 [Pandoraea aquatica]|uniref:Uncharacterized protein n=1 Tax=Pandoraea aquatica TaxID=2508290 RepID=A0A5E4Z0D6_9BURK|nr:hypothetical protein [Pandoraea aquatica]VVE54691.1 hypothetical protein PAQ31011_04961 [Pandoraea aquatica]